MMPYVPYKNHSLIYENEIPLIENKLIRNRVAAQSYFEKGNAELLNYLQEIEKISATR